MEEPAVAPVDTVRINIAFEQMVAASVTAAVAAGVISFVLGMAVSLMSGFSFGALVIVFVNAMLAAFVTFLCGFAGSVVIGAPLFIFLEKKKRREMWPWLAAALATALVFYLLAPGSSVGGMAGLARVAAIFAPPVIFAVVFVRGMTPFWRAAERAEAAAATTNIVRLH
ncbi:MAG: hypothetical protein R3C58_01365 [Parvularculaceae bacterium]